MKLIGKHIEKDRSVGPFLTLFFNMMLVVSYYRQGYVNVRPEEDEDMWHLYNLIQEVS